MKYPKLSAARKKTGSPWNIGRIPWNKGKHGAQAPFWLGKKRPFITCQRISKTKKGKFCGTESHNWIDDRYKVVPRAARKAWRNEVLKRDEYRCHFSGKECKGRLEAHHILRWGEFPKLRYDVNNGITLCHFHHPHGRENEMKLSPYFQELVASLE